MDLKKHITDFVNEVIKGKIEVYNEFSLQHELGIFLRERLSSYGYKIQFERNTKYFNIENTIKHEIDIVIFKNKDDKNDRYAIELKYPRHGAYPRRMFAFVKDIKFMEELKEHGFANTYCLTLVEDKNFYSDKNDNGIYKYFRNIDNQSGKKLAGKKLDGTIKNPIGKNNSKEKIKIEGTYKIVWQGDGDKKYYLLESNPNQP